MASLRRASCTSRRALSARAVLTHALSEAAAPLATARLPASTSSGSTVTVSRCLRVVIRSSYCCSHLTRTSSREHLAEELGARPLEHVRLRESRPRLLGSEQVPIEAVLHHPTEVRDVQVRGKVDHRSERRGAADAMDRCDVGFGDVVIVEDRLFAADAHELGRATVGVDIDIVDNDVVVLVGSILVEATTARQHL